MQAAIDKNGEVIVEPLPISYESIDQLENNLVLFFTGKERSASEILEEQGKKTKEDDPQMVQNLHQIKEIALETKKYLESGEINMLGELLHVHWETKKKRSSKMSYPLIDECYKAASELDLDLCQSWMIGDGLTYLKAGEIAGCRTILIGKMKCELCHLMDEMNVRPDFIASNLLEAARAVSGTLSSRYELDTCFLKSRV